MTTELPRNSLPDLSAMLSFVGPDLTGTLANIKSKIAGQSSISCVDLLSNSSASHGALRDASILKKIAGQVDVIIHALGILRCLPQILNVNEKVKYVSLEPEIQVENSIWKMI